MLKRLWVAPIFILASLSIMPPTFADEDIVRVEMNLTDFQGEGHSVGSVLLQDSAYGLLLTPNLHNLPPGAHGFHIHTNPSCLPGEKNNRVVPGLAAGGHFDPLKTNVHEGPYGNGHLGDLPPLFVGGDGTAKILVLAPRLQLNDVKNRSLMVHLKSDNFSDHPAPLGGGGARLACGVIGE